MSADPAAPARPGRGLARRAGRLLALVTVGLFLALLVYGVVSRNPSRRIDEGLARSQAVQPPAFELPVLLSGRLGRGLEARLETALADGRVSSAELRGVPVVVNYWASWCPPCRTEAPLLERGWRAMRAKGVLFLGLDMQDLTGDARAYLREFGISYPNVRDGSNRVARSWGVTGLPETFFLSAQGRVVGHVIGAVSVRQLADGVSAARSGRPLRTRTGGERQPTR
jgi:cytochrome c biogenesis protein CcmG, thiol:disulfide interchange protein DsbE